MKACKFSDDRISMESGLFGLLQGVEVVALAPAATGAFRPDTVTKGKTVTLVQRPVHAWILVQTCAAKKALKTGIRTQAIQRQVRFQNRGKVQELLRVSFIQELERFLVFVEAGMDGSHPICRSRTVPCLAL